jgi:Tol biopolymer transport system component
MNNRSVRTNRRRSSLLVACVLASSLGGPLAWGAGTTWQVSVATGGEPALCATPGSFCYSISAAISADGRYVSFSSEADNLASVAGSEGVDTTQIYLHDRLACTTTLVTRSLAGGFANSSSSLSSLSADGRYLAFDSSATNLLPGVDNGLSQVYLYDRTLAGYTLISGSPLIVGQEGNGASAVPTLSADGRYVSFQSAASDLVAGDTNGLIDIFVHDRQTQITVRVNVTDAGHQAEFTGGPNGGHARRPSMSSDGRFVVYDSGANNLSDNPAGDFRAYRHDRDSDGNGVFDEPGGIDSTLVSVDSGGVAANGQSYWPTVTADGSLVAFISTASNLVPNDTNGELDVFVHDLVTAQTTRESVGPAGEQGSSLSFWPKLSAGGEYLSFHSASPEFVGGGAPTGSSQVLRRDRATGQLAVISVNTAGDHGNSSSEQAVMTPNARIFAFSSVAGNLVASDPNIWADVYARSLRPADINNDGVVDDYDLTLARRQLGAVCTSADVNGDGIVDDEDLLAILSDWG